MKNLTLKNRKIETNHTINRGLVPGVIYGKHISSRPVYLNWRDLRSAKFGRGEVFNTKLDGKDYFVKLEEVQRDPVTREMIHFSLVELPKNNASEVEIPIVFSDTPKGVKDGGVFVVLRDEIKVSGMPSRMPPVLKSSVKHLNIGDKLRISDIQTPNYVELSESESESDIVAICQPPTKEPIKIAKEQAI